MGFWLDLAKKPFSLKSATFVAHRVVSPAGIEPASKV